MKLKLGHCDRTEFPNMGELAFVTGGALLCIKPIRRDAKHVVALDANTVENRAYNRRRRTGSFRIQKVSLGGGGFDRHELIVTHGR